MSLYFIHSGARKRHNRTKRMQAATNAPFVQYIGNLVIRRARPVLVDEATLQQYLPQLKVADAEGKLEVRTQDGRLIDLATMSPVVGEEAPKAPPPAPNFLPDSAARDIPAGVPMPMYQEGAGITQDVEAPVIVQQAFEEPSAEPAREPALVKDRKGGKKG